MHQIPSIDNSSSIKEAAARLLDSQTRDFLVVEDNWSKDGTSISQDARMEYLRCFRNPKVITAICEEYRSSETDLQHDRNDRMNGKRITCPTLILWSEDGFTASFGDPLAIWENWSDDVRGLSLSCGHFLMEEAPEEVCAEIKRFLKVR